LNSAKVLLVYYAECIIWAIVHPKVKICWTCIHHQAIQDVDEFVFSSEQIWRNARLFSSEWVPSEWESKELVKTYIICYPHDSSPSINNLLREKSHVYIKPSNTKTFLMSNRLKSTFIILLPPMKKSSHLIWIRREICIDQAPFRSKKSKRL